MTLESTKNAMSESVIDSEIGLLTRMVSVLWKNRLMIGAFALGFAVVFAGLSYLLPVKYRARAKVIPASLVTDSGSMPVSGSILSMAQSAGLSLGGSSSDPSALVPEILKSEDFTSRLLEQKFVTSSGDSTTLIEALEVDEADEQLMSRAHRALCDGVLGSSFDAKSGVTSVTVLMNDATLAADLANRVTQELDTFNLQMRTSQARYELAFITRRLEEVGSELAVAEDALTRFRENNRTIDASPQLLLEAGRLQREVELQQSLFLTLKTQEEVALIQELKSVPSLRLLERARIPMDKYSPRRAVLAMSGFVLGIAVALIILLFRAVPSRP